MTKKQSTEQKTASELATHFYIGLVKMIVNDPKTRKAFQDVIKKESNGALELKVTRKRG